MVKIVQNGDPVLREKAKLVDLNEIGSPKIKKIIGRMKIAVDSQDDGVAIAAPQIGESLQIFIVSGKAYDFIKNIQGSKDEIFINPKVIKISKDKQTTDEGCLSVRWLYGKTRRSSRITVEALDENGKKKTVGASGLLSHILQHEYDHLQGVLFIDHAKELQDLPPERQVELG